MTGVQTCALPILKIKNCTRIHFTAPVTGWESVSYHVLNGLCATVHADGCQLVTHCGKLYDVQMVSAVLIEEMNMSALSLDIYDIADNLW